MVSMPSLHFFRWTEQLKEAGHDVFWFDITGYSNKANRIDWVEQKVGWKPKWNFPGRIFIKKNLSFIYHIFQYFNERTVAVVFEQYLREVKPDVVHSFAMHISCFPILEVMKRYNDIKWVYSSWGSDLYARKNSEIGKHIINMTLPHLDFLFTDCHRDFEIAKQNGFTGHFLGVFPGGGGYDLNLLESNNILFEKRDLILVKGYQGIHGKCIEVLKILSTIENELLNYKIVVFGANLEVVSFFNQSNAYQNIDIVLMEQITHQEVLKFMGRAKFYIGYSESDGIPNTLLEAICSGCIPLQSNPGGATSELIKDDFNGFILDMNNIKSQILNALSRADYSEGLKYNKEVLCPELSYDFVKDKVLKSYDVIHKKRI